MTLSQYVKQSGLKSTTELVAICGRQQSTLDRWFKEDKKLFDCLIKGAVLTKTIKQLEKTKIEGR